MLPLGLAALVLIMLSRQLLGGSTLLYNDLLWLMYPLRSFANAELMSGRIPLWDPFRYCGLPFVGNIESAVFYPPNWASLVIPLERFFAWSAAFHYWLAAWGTALLARQLGLSRGGAFLAGAAYGLGGTMILSTFSGAHLPAQAWLPWLVWTMATGRGLACGLVLAMPVLAGSAQFAVYSWLTLLGFALLTRGRAALPDLARAHLVAGLLTAIQVLPFLELARYTSRAALHGVSLSSEYVFKFSPEWLLPERTSTLGYYLPTLVGLLALFGWKGGSRGLKVAGVLGLLAWLASLHPVGALPMFRAPVRWLFVTSLALALLAGHGWQRWGSRALAGLVVLDLLWLGIPRLPVAQFSGEPEAFTQLAQLRPEERTLFTPYVDTRYYNWGLVARRPLACGYGAVALGDYVRFVGRAGLGKPLTLEQMAMIAEASNMLPFRKLDPPYASLLGLGTVVYCDENSPQLKVLSTRAPAPRCFVVHEARRVDDAGDAFEQLAAIDPHRVVLLEGDHPSTPSTGPDEIRCTLFEPGRLEYAVQAGGAGYAVLSEVWYPGWEARVDDQPAEVLRAYGLVRAVAVPAGSHRLELVYAPASFRWGAALTGLGLLLTGGLAARGWAARRRAR